jgi:SAM-dependent methyltransferase
MSARGDDRRPPRDRQVSFYPLIMPTRAPSPNPSPNAEAIGVWNEILVPKFTRYRRVFVEGSAPHSAQALALHPLRPGERVLDIGCGFGETTIELARAVGPSGSALGVDVGEGFIDTARADAARAGVGNVRFQLADAQVSRFDETFDVCFSRFGTMFFANPAAALGNLRQAMTPGGRLVMVVWRRIEDNEWASLSKAVARRHLPPPADEAPSCGPGPFSMADVDTVKAVLAAAGWKDPVFEQIDADFTLGATVEEAVAFQLTIGPAGEIIRDAAALGEEKRPAIVAELGERLRPLAGPRGVVVRASSWCVTAGA